MVLFFLFKMFNGSKNDKLKTFNDIENIMLSVHNEINLHMKEYEHKRLLSEQLNNKIIEQKSYNELKEKINLIPSEIREAINNSKNKI